MKSQNLVMVSCKKKPFIFFLIFCFLLLLFRIEASASTDQFITGEGVGATFEGGKSPRLGDPVSAASGAYYFTMPLLSLGGLMDFGFNLIYRSDYLRFSEQFLPATFWWFPYAEATLGRSIDTTEYGTVYLPNGDNVSFKKDALGNWTLTDPSENFFGFILLVDNRPQIKYVLKETTDFAYLMDPVNERVYIFEKYSTLSFGRFYRIVRIVDRNGNQVIYTHEAGGFDPKMNPLKENRVIKIEDGLGRFMNLTYGHVINQSYLQTVTDQNGRQVRLIYDAGGTDNGGSATLGGGVTLRSVINTMTQTTTFQYAGVLFGTNNLISKQIRPQGNTPYTQAYAPQEIHDSPFIRVISQADAYGNTRNLTYTTPNDSITVTRPDGTTEKYETYSSHGLLKSLTDPTNKKAEFTKDVDEHITSVKDRIGDTTSFTYHAETGKLASITNAKVNTITYTYTQQDQTFTNPLPPSEQVAFAFYNLTRVDYPDGTNEQFTYDAKGNMVTRIDRAGKTWSYTYNPRGQVLTETNPLGGVITYIYNAADATLVSITDSDTGVTTYQYDALKRVTRTDYPDNTNRQIAYNANDQVTRVTDERGNVTNYEYDANGNLVKITDPSGNLTQFAYNQMDRVNQMTNRLGKTTQYTYDVMNQLASLTDPTGVQFTFSYDPRGWLNRVGHGGHLRTIGYDDEGVVSSQSTPSGKTFTFQTDKVGDLSAITNPLGQTMTYGRDNVGRIISITDALGRTTNYAYDSSGFPSGVTMPVIGTANYQRNDLGLLTQITDLNGQNWSFSYTTMGRRQSQTDPLGNILQFTHDNRGRLSQTSYPGGGTQARTRDGVGNITRRQYSAGPDLQFTYNSLNWLTVANEITFTRDPGGRVINTENTDTGFGATYDDAGRLKTATYNNGAFTVTYTYDAQTGLLAQVTDSLTGTQIGFAYDNDFNPTAINRSNGVNTTLTWDNSGRLIRIQDGSIIDIQYTLNGAGQVMQANMTLPLNPSEFLVGGTETFTYNAASQVSTAGYSYDQQGRLTASPGRTYNWDGASRPTAINGAILAYNGVGDIRIRAEGEQTTHYYYNYAIGLRPIVAEKNEGTDQFLRYYVWTPSGRLLYMIDAANGNKVYFYHFDRVGSTLALTDSSGTVTDEYAYDPYGELLSHQGSNPQPFTFVGERGVREEGASGNLYHIRARYYDALTARFISREAIWPRIDDPRTLNPYQYAVFDPVSKFDVNGMFEDYPTPEDLSSMGRADLAQELAGLKAELKEAKETAAELYRKEVSEEEIEQELARLNKIVLRAEAAEKKIAEFWQRNRKIVEKFWAKEEAKLKAKAEEREKARERLKKLIQESLDYCKKALAAGDYEDAQEFLQFNEQFSNELKNLSEK